MEQDQKIAKNELEKTTIVAQNSRVESLKQLCATCIAHYLAKTDSTTYKNNLDLINSVPGHIQDNIKETFIKKYRDESSFPFSQEKTVFSSVKLINNPLAQKNIILFPGGKTFAISNMPADNFLLCTKKDNAWQWILFRVPEESSQNICNYLIKPYNSHSFFVAPKKEKLSPDTIPTPAHYYFYDLDFLDEPINTYPLESTHYKIMTNPMMQVVISQGAKKEAEIIEPYITIDTEYKNDVLLERKKQQRNFSFKTAMLSQGNDPSLVICDHQQMLHDFKWNNNEWQWTTIINPDMPYLSNETRFRFIEKNNEKIILGIYKSQPSFSFPNQIFYSNNGSWNNSVLYDNVIGTSLGKNTIIYYNNNVKRNDEVEFYNKNEKHLQSVSDSWHSSFGYYTTMFYESACSPELLVRLQGPVRDCPKNPYNKQTLVNFALQDSITIHEPRSFQEILSDIVMANDETEKKKIAYKKSLWMHKKKKNSGTRKK